MALKLRNEVLEQYTWDVKSVFLDDEKWQEAYNLCLKKIPELNNFKNTLNNEENLLKCFKLNEEIAALCEKIYFYAHINFYVDTTNNHYQGFADMATNIVVNYGAQSSFIESELLKVDEKLIANMLETNKELEKYNHYFDNLYRVKKHIMSPEIEEILAKASEIGNSADDIYSIFKDADMTFETIKGEDGKDVTLSHGNYSVLIESKNRTVRQNAFKTYYKPFMNFKNTFATAFSANVKKDFFFADSRKYDSSLGMALSSYNIPKEVYTNLIKTVEKFLPVMYDYVSIRKKRLGLEEIHMYDMYTPMVKEADTKINFDDAKETVLKALEPMGKDYIDTIKEAFNNRWIDIYENKGKRTGAFSWSVYGVHPYVLLNFNNKIDDMFTLAHELGHAMHSYYSNKSQPFVYSSYTIFVAEVASTVNEALLMEYLLKETKDPIFKDYLLCYFAEQFKGTVFRQTMFAEFEMITHKMSQNGEPLTVDVLCSIYKDLVLKYFGKEVVLDDEIAMEWSRIPHFYSSFYVYQYATGYSAAIDLSKKILTDEESRNNYLEFLKGGSSDYSINLLKSAGVDMSKPEPIENALQKFKELIDILGKAAN